MGEGPGTLSNMNIMTPPAENQISYPISTASMPIRKYRQKEVLGGRMNNEEIRMNKEMLHEIKQFKL
jgi:hypothetical protein